VSRSNPRQYVNVIGRAIDDEGRSTHFTNYAAEIGEQIGANFGSDQRLAAFRTEDQMKDDVSAGLRQGFLRPFQGSRLIQCLPRACALG